MRYRMTKCRALAKRVAVLFCAIAMTLELGAVAVLAAPTVKKTEYDKNGVVEVDFRNKVQYKNVKVTVKDNTGATYKTRIKERDDDELEFVILKYRTGRTYSYTISGVRARGERSYSKVTGKVKIPAKKAALRVKKIKYDREDKELDIDFSAKVFYKKASIKITDGNKTYKATITDRDDDEMEVFVRGLTRGKSYKYTITGVGKKGTNKTVTLSGSFKA